MSTIQLKRARIPSDVSVGLYLKDNGVAVSWASLENVTVQAFSVDQNAVAGPCQAAPDASDPTRLNIVYPASTPQYPGTAKLIVFCKYRGRLKSYDVPVVYFVKSTEDVTGYQVIDDPEVDVAIQVVDSEDPSVVLEVADVSTSLLDQAIEDAETAAERANTAAAAAEHMIDIHTGPAGKSPYIGENGHWFEWNEETHQYIDTETNAKGDTGETPDIAIGTVTTAEPGTPAAATMTGTPEAPVLNLIIPKGAVGTTPNFTIGSVNTGAPGSQVVVTITGTAEAPVLNITIPQGIKGDTGVSADYPITIHNGLDSDATDEALAAAQGKILQAEISQLGQEVDELINGEKVPVYVSLEDIGVAIPNEYMDSSTGKPMGATNCIITKPIYLDVGDVVSCETGGTSIVLFFSLNDGSTITTNTSVKQSIKVANSYSHNTTYEATIEEAGWYGFSGRNNRNDGTNLVVSVTKYSRGEGIVDRVDGISEQVDGISEQVDGIVNGETSSEEITLNEIDGDGALLDYFLNYNLEKPNGASNCIITKPIYLNMGDHVECQTGGTGIGLFAKSPSGSISQITTGFVTIVQANSSAITTYSANIEEEGWYVFSGRINRTDGTNLAVTITKFVQGKGIYELLDEKANKKDIGDLNIPSVGLSIGADSVKDNIPTTPWFDADADSEGMDYGTYLDDKLDSVPFGKRFIFITDCHYDGGNKGAAPLIDYARRRLGIKTIIHGGDVHNEAVTAQDAVGKWLQFNRDFAFRIGNDFKQVLGDHDRNGGSGHTPIQYEVMQRLLDGYNANELVFDNLYDEQVSTLGWSAADMSQYNAFKRMHYYFDDVSIKTRFVVLVTRIIPQGQGLVYDKLGNYDSEVLLLQMDFLHDALMSTPNGYNVIVCGHNVIGNQGVSGHTGWYDTSIPIYKGYWRSVVKHIRAFKSKGTCNTSYLNWESSEISTKEYDYRGAGNVNIVFCIGGDVHWDILAKSQATNEDLANVISGTTINADDILHVVTMTDGTDRGYRDANGELIMHPATLGTIDSQAFDIVTIAEDGVYFTRIGSGNDRVVYLTPN